MPDAAADVLFELSVLSSLLDDLLAAQVETDTVVVSQGATNL